MNTKIKVSGPSNRIGAIHRWALWFKKENPNAGPKCWFNWAKDRYCAEVHNHHNFHFYPLRKLERGF